MCNSIRPSTHFVRGWGLDHFCTVNSRILSSFENEGNWLYPQTVRLTEDTVLIFQFTKEPRVGESEQVFFTSTK